MACYSCHALLLLHSSPGLGPGDMSIMESARTCPGLLFSTTFSWPSSGSYAHRQHYCEHMSMHLEAGFFSCSSTTGRIASRRVTLPRSHCSSLKEQDQTNHQTSSLVQFQSYSCLLARQTGWRLLGLKLNLMG